MNLLKSPIPFTITIHHSHFTNSFSILIAIFFCTDINKGSPIDYKSGSACSTPTKDTLKGYERSTQGCMGPVLPPRSVVMPGIQSHHYSAPMNFRKDLAARCSAKCVAIVSISVFVTLCVLLIFLTGKYKENISMCRKRTNFKLETNSQSLRIKELKGLSKFSRFKLQYPQ